MRLSKVAALALMSLSYKLNVRVFGAGRFRLFNISNTSGLGREFDRLH